MIIDHRTYNVKPGQLPDWLAAYKEYGREPQMRILGNLIGYFTSMDIGELSQVVHLWGYESLQDRADRRAELAKDPNWQKFVEVGMPMLQHLENKILTPTDFSPMQ